MKKIILLIISIYSLNSQATSDYSVKATARAYPMGASVAGDVGYGYKLWSKSKNEKVLYGYIRPSLNLQSSGLVNYAKAQIDLFPISFLGFYYSKVQGQRSLKNLQGFNCKAVDCNSNLSKDQYGYKLALAYKEFKLVNFYDIHDINYDDSQLSFAEETSNLVLSKDDKLFNNISVLGYQINEELMLAVLNSYYRTKNSRQSSNMLMAVGAYSKDKMTYQVGLGNFHNRDAKDHFSALVIINWNGEKGVRLF